MVEPNASPDAPDAKPRGIEISKRLIVINSISTLLDRAVNIGLVLWIHQHLIKRVSPEEYSIYPVMMSLMAVVPLVMGIVIGGLGRFVIAAYARDDQRRVTQVVSTMVPICAAGGALILLIGLVVSWFVDDLLVVEPDFAWDARLMFAILVFNVALRMGTAPYKLGISVRQKFYWAHLIALSSQLLRLGVLFALLFGVSTRVLWVVVATVPSTLLEQVVTIALSRRLVPAIRFQRDQIRRKLIRPIVSLGGWGMVSRISVVLRELVTMVLLKRWLSPVEVGSYGLGLMVDQRLRSSAMLPLSTAGPAMTAMHATGQVERLRRSYFRLGRYLLWTFTLTIVPLLIFRHEAWALYLGAEYETYQSVTAVTVFLLGRIFFLFPVPALAMVAVSQGRTRPMGVAALIVEGLNTVFVLAMILAGHMGAPGVALALFGVGAVIYPLVHWRLGLTMTGARAGEWFGATFARGGLPVVLALPVWLALAHWAPPRTWLALGAEFAAGAAVFAVGLALVLEQNERHDLRRIRKKMLALLPGGRAPRDGPSASG